MDLPQEQTVALELVAYEDRLAVYEQTPWVDPSGAGGQGIRVTLPFRQWEDLGRPTVIQVTWSIEAG